MNNLEDFLNWHYSRIWPRLTDHFFNLVLFSYYFSGIPHHLPNLLAPWKRIRAVKGRGFQLSNYASVVGFNLTSRFMGFFLRLTAIFTGLTMMLLLPFLYLPVLIGWLLLPFVSLPFYVSRKKNFNEETAEIMQALGNGQYLKKFCLSQTGRFCLIRLGLDPGSIIAKLPPFSILPMTTPDNAENLYNQIYENLSFLPEISANKISKDDFFTCLNWYRRLESLTLRPLLEDKKRIRALPGIGIDWSYGYTVELDKYAHDLTAEPTPFPFLLGRDAEIKKMERALLKSENKNVMLIGVPGIARHMLVETLARHLYLGMSEKELSHKRIMKVDMHALCSDKKNLQEIKAVFSQIYEESEKAGNIILFIDDFDKYASEGEGRLNLTDVIEKFARSSIGLIGLTTPDDYHQFLEKNSLLGGLFEEIFLLAPDLKTVITELEISIVPVLERRYNTVISLAAVKKTVEDADRYLTATPFPGKAIELLENAIIASNRNKFIRSDDIDKYLTEKLKIPIGKLLEGEKEKLANLEDYLHRRIINQQMAIRMIASALRRARMNVSSSEKPIGSFLFLGPTGVGKTETAKALSSVYYGGEDKMLRFDMSQYQGEEGMARLIGSSAGQKAGELTTKLSVNPFSLLLFDEIEKAPKEIQHLFLTLLDEGYLHDASGKKIDCRQTIIIATSNAGSEYIREQVAAEASPQKLQDQIVDHVLREKIFSPEFLNRFDGTVVFTPLSQGHLRQVARLMLENLNSRIAQKAIRVNPSDELVNYLASTGNSREFGARAMRRTIETTLEDYIAKRLLDGKLKEGSQITVDPNLLTDY
ncbi:MAG: negative regulator of genetic competence ClpC/ATP-dependent Clp protease ATP-binding subunit ClpC [Candidatus Gottesmanbacteria bacterium GW2011_GWA2_43_14]|uniref:Negative regulator of genetic competence ClpC/ATP-dependent Clp protease ATP-binding subunit ClpC n=1 Tax=Candidatus Gottesmanbacteria bacterium GW2011_GWA2_43_14 TaxID=1618443 RepID=A0A0G1DIA4_9BACT|nr:MAG: negative regulator of genetic competence ClpC/ATP-dependent Clp protease ATP-binding subunit ClpC [Candidatus Gottesmanbacteria bacterium GW2011_GWA2_43_14]